MKVSGFEKLSLVDFEGKIGSTIFLNGCNFRCPFCHNALLIYATAPEIEFEEVLAYLKKRKGIIEAVCITGGEPAVNPHLREIVVELKKIGMYVKLDTNGSRFEIVKDLLEEGLVDYVAMDIKNSFTHYGKTIGGTKLGDVEKTMKWLMNSGYDYEFRTTLVKELHTEEDIYEMKKMLTGAKRLYLQKFDDHNGDIKNLSCINIEEANKFKDILSESIGEVHLRGY